MLVTKNNFDKALGTLTLAAKRDKALGYDTETTCLNYWDTPWFDSIGLKPRVFSVQMATRDMEFYFDFNHSSDRLGDTHFAKIQAELCANPEMIWFIANAPFDINHSLNHGIDFAGVVHCTKAIARVVNNLEPHLGLDKLGEKYLGVGKESDFAALCKERGHVTKLKKFGYNDKFEEILHFDRMPLEDLVRYGDIDARRAFDLGVWQRKKVLEIDREIKHSAPLANVLDNECKLTKLISKMGRTGILIDRAYTEEAYEHEVKEYQKIEAELNRIAGTPVNWLSAKQLKPIFDAKGIPYAYTEKGNACFDSDALEDSDSELAKLILQYRHHNKRAHTYFENFIWLADRNNVLHADAQQAGTGFGRMSYWNPNLQNVPKRSDKDEEKYKVRRCFIPRPGKVLCDFDYDGAEFVMGIDYAREMSVVEQLKAGLDPHGDLARRMSIPDRDSAKTMQFRIFYGGGGSAVGRALGYKGADADRIGKQKKREYFERMPAIRDLIYRVSDVAGSRGYILNWFGRVLKYDRQTNYKAFNGLIQSGVGDMTKVGMVRLDFEVPAFQMLIQVHDSLVGELDPGDSHLTEQICNVLASVYPYKVIQMKSSGAYSLKSWSDLNDEWPSA